MILFVCLSSFYLFPLMLLDMLTELSRREKAANIKPDADIDAFMKASEALNPDQTQ